MVFEYCCYRRAPGGHVRSLHVSDRGLERVWYDSRAFGHPQDVKIEVAVRDGGRCRQCGSNKELHFDHVIPWSKGGRNTVDNIQLLCRTCNRRKGADDIPADLPPSPYRQPWRSPAADSRPSQPPGTYKSPPPLSYMSEQETEPTCPACGMLSALHTGAPCPGNR
jgi:5-methylcytosine-specific restriction endonuclease McrA